MIDREIEHDAAADRTSHHHGPVEFQHAAEGADGLGVARGGELVFLAAPAHRRIRLAMPGQVEGYDTEIFRKLCVSEQMPPLPPVRARGVQTHQRNARTILLEIDAVHLATDVDMDIATDDRLDVTTHDGTTAK
jgi:hypothetical protein